MLVATVGSAEPVIVIDANGNYFYNHDGDGGDMEALGKPIIYRLPGAPNPQPPNPNPPNPQPPDPQPPAPTELRGEVKSWADEVDKPLNATILAGMYGLLADKLADGTIGPTPGEVNTAMNGALDLVFRETKGKSWEVSRRDWSLFDDRVTTALAAMVGSDETATKAEWVAFFRDVQGGLRDSSQGTAIPDWLQPIIQLLIQLLLDFLLNPFTAEEAVTSVSGAPGSHYEFLRSTGALR